VVGAAFNRRKRLKIPARSPIDGVNT
jgi:hypothetical protein